MKKVILLILIVGLSFEAVGHSSNVAIHIAIERGDTVSVKYFQPFKRYANRYIPTISDNYVFEDVQLDFETREPTMVRIVIEQKEFNLFVEPGDSLELIVSKNSRPEVEIRGANYIGQRYYNQKYNAIKVDKFERIRDAFYSVKHLESAAILQSLMAAINRETLWIDSLLAIEEVSAAYGKYLKTEVRSILAWEAGELCVKNFEQIGMEGEKSSQIKAGLFRQIDPLAEELKRCFASSSYYYTYFYELYKTKSALVNAHEVLVPEEPFFHLAPVDIREFIVGASLFVAINYLPGKHDYCQLAKKYKQQFTDGPFIGYFDSKVRCGGSAGQVKRMGEWDTDLFGFMHQKFQGKRVFLDLWATWCGPCKQEFRNYDSAFYNFMTENDFAVVFISIDKAKDKERWEKEIMDMDIAGYHHFAGELMKESIKDVVYNGGTVSIPRYLVFDESGKLLSSDFLRPSHSQFYNELKKLLKQ